jgi:regulator of protease activity HflC (stomatin/prohibitin superfamily)
MGDFLRVLLDGIQYLWPFVIVRQSEDAGFYVGGRLLYRLSAYGWSKGIYFRLPFFTEIRQAPNVPGMIRTARLDLTLKDGTMVTVAASAWARVTDFGKAIEGVDDYKETAEETFAAVIAERLAEEDADRVIAGERRSRLLTSLTGWVNKETQAFGVEVSNVRFTTFAINVKTFRLMQDLNAMGTW